MGHAPFRSPRRTSSGTARARCSAGLRPLARLRIGGERTDRTGSDLDLLVESPEGTSLLRLIGLQHAIGDLLGVRVDLCTERELHPALRERILAEARAV
jgi:hypothetical protein